MRLNFQIKVFFPKKAFIAQCGFFCHVIRTIQRTLCAFAGKARRECNQALVIFLQCGKVYARFIIEAFHPTGGDNFHKIMITGLIFRQQNQMIARAVFVIETVLCHIYFTPDDRLDAGIFGRFIKLNHTEHVAVIRYGDGIHALFAHGIHQPINAAKTVQQTKLCMQMEVCKRHSALLSEFNAFLLPKRLFYSPSSPSSTKAGNISAISPCMAISARESAGVGSRLRRIN